MIGVDIDELRAELDRYLALVRDGSAVLVTEDGAPVARIVPVDPGSAFEQLVAEGVIELPTAPKLSSIEPVTPADPTLRLSEQVIADRR
ncbi:type II toxin-antitoxin system Phd/YefM family antitoxin [Klenkia sp. PcliD-1-E]|uniref:type II toxin-antitoxin system Phd/YefM family antitoxin n=1 Tax=Klenkia sp. PcliD-1-E TaxID=2954492 RepID=UPI00209689E3|nr:type II toxin-antitoxin system prevent-host-death family antitoxin [Klenkia sp. PcliD-1-E]MCO7218507.1 type II toxin-antitoxin system prevent-host-death family antitoxin [Klenkia sp. PcliD-1-E]